MEQNPWDRRTDDSRSEDTVTTFIIFCEDEVSEPAYLRSFTVPGKVKVNAVENQDKHWRNLNNAITDCIKNDLIEPFQGSFRVKEGTTTNIWSAYDRDMEREVIDNFVLRNDSIFSIAIEASEKVGIKVAWSNDAFELWLLLHFEQIPTGARLHRDYLYQRLTENIRAIPDKSPDLVSLTGKANFSYELYFKRRDRFVAHILPLLTEARRDIAIVNARELEATYQKDSPFHDRNPCTMIHHLVHDLLAAQ